RLARLLLRNVARAPGACGCARIVGPVVGHSTQTVTERTFSGCPRPFLRTERASIGSHEQRSSLEYQCGTVVAETDAREISSDAFWDGTFLSRSDRPFCDRCRRRLFTQRSHGGSLRCAKVEGRALVRSTKLWRARKEGQNDDSNNGQHGRRSEDS